MGIGFDEISHAVAPLVRRCLKPFCARLHRGDACSGAIDITIHTFIQDLAEVIQTEELADVILVAHSFGAPITGVADRMPEKLRHLVYLDAIVLENGQTGFRSTRPRKFLGASWP